MQKKRIQGDICCHFVYNNKILETTYISFGNCLKELYCPFTVKYNGDIAINEIVVEVKTNIALWRTLALFTKTKHILTYDPALIIEMPMYIHQRSYMKTLIAVLFIIIPKLETSQISSTVESINKLHYIYTKWNSI